MARAKKGGHPGKRPVKKLRVIAEPAEGTRTVLKGTADTIFFTGIGGRTSTDFACGKCGRVLMQGVGPRQRLVNIVVECPDCGSYNDTGGAPELN